MPHCRTPKIAVAVLAAVAGALCGVGCQGDGDFKVFGYTTKPPYDPNIRSVYIPVFKMQAYHTNPHRGLERDITEEIVTELNRRRSPIRVVSDPARADTELIGTIIQMNKFVYNRTSQNENREFELFVSVDVVWRDLRSGKVLSGTRAPTNPPAEPAFDPNLPAAPPPPADGIALPVRINAYGRVLPELGETDTTGAKSAAQQIARQIVNMMEASW